MTRPGYFAYDTETTSLNPELGEIISLYGVVTDDDLNILRAVEVYAHPDHMEWASPEALAVNGYEPGLWDQKGAVSQAEMVKFLDTFFGDDTRLIPIGHNCPYDVAMLDHTYRRHGQPGRTDKLFQHYRIDTVSLVFALDFSVFGRKQGQYNLSKVCARLGIPLANAHEAKSDVEASLGLLRYIVGTFRTAMQACPELVASIATPETNTLVAANIKPPPAPRREGKFIGRDENGIWRFRYAKHAGKRVDEVEWDYLQWLLSKGDEFTWSDEQKEYLVATLEQSKIAQGGYRR